MDVPLRSRRGSLALIGLAGLAGCALSFTPADAQQVIAGKGSVTIDLGVLDQLGPPVAGAYAPGGQASSYPAAGYSQPSYGQTSQTRGGLQFPPTQYPVSALTVPPPAGSAPYVPSTNQASMPAASASSASTASAGGSAPAATSSTVAAPPPPPSETPATVPMATATTTGSDTTT